MARTSRKAESRLECLYRPAKILHQRMAVVQFIVYAHVDTFRDRVKHGSESIIDPQCIIDLLEITSCSFHKKLSSSLTTNIISMHLLTRPFGPLPFLSTDYGMVYGMDWRA